MNGSDDDRYTFAGGISVELVAIDHSMKVLFITRAYPPSIGGMQTFARDFYENYRRHGEIDLVANPGGRKNLIGFLLKACFYIVAHAREYDIIHVYDAVMAPLVPIIRLFSRAKVSFTVNGLDIVYPRFGYQKVIPFFLKRADKVIAISKYTMGQCETRGIPEERLRAIPIGVEVEHPGACTDAAVSALLDKFNINAEGRRFLLTVGRLVKRKGHGWFISEVLAKLPEDYVYLIAGVGPESSSVNKLIRELCLTDRAYLLGAVSEEEKVCLYRLADLFVMPNIHVPGDQEGFGIVLLEASIHGLPVVASNMEGIADAVVDGMTGRLVQEKDAHAFVEAIRDPGIDRSTVASTVESRFGWQNIIQMYQREFLDTIL